MGQFIPDRFFWARDTDAPAENSTPDTTADGDK
jgi:hypothetical protein